MTDSRIEIARVAKDFTVNGRPLRALDGIDLTVAPGEFVTIVGASGCGKSTLLRIVAGLDPAHDGAVRHDGRPVTGPSLQRGIVFQEPRLFPWLTVAENIGLGLENARTGYDLDGPLPEPPETNGPKSRQKLLIERARRDNLTIRELYLAIAGARGHWQVVGTASQIADQLEERFRSGGADGFNVMAPYLPGGLEDFVTHVVPELRRRGLFREAYEGRTLRDHLGLPKPVHRVPRAPARQAAE